VLRISQELVKETGCYSRTKKAAELALREIDAARKEGKLKLSEREETSLENLLEEVSELPSGEGELIEEVIGDCEKLDPKKYDM
jgi:hypothetical protein